MFLKLYPFNLENLKEMETTEENPRRAQQL